MKMKEEVKYVCQEGPLLDEKKGLPLTAVYQETTITNGKVLRPQVLGFTDKYCTPNVCSRLRLVITILALAACVAVIIVLLSNGIHASNNRETAQEEEIRELKEKLDAQQVRLHRMQKELQFLVTRERAFEAREDMVRRRQLPIVEAPNSRPVVNPKIEADSAKSDPDLPMVPRRSGIWDEDEDEIDVDKLPIASPNKRFRSGKLPSTSTDIKN